MRTTSPHQRSFPPPTAWKVAPGVVWIQVHDPASAKKLSRIAGGRLVSYSVAGPYVRIFEFNKPLEWAKDWIARHRVTNKPFSGLADRQSDSV